MVRIPLVRRQPKDGSPQSKDGKGKDGSQPASSSEKGRPAQPSGAKDGKKTSLPASPPDKDHQPHPQWAGTGEKIPFPLKPPDEEEVAPPPKAPIVEETSVSLTPPEKGGSLRVDRQKSDKPSSGPDSALGVSGSVATQAESEIQINWPPKPVQPPRTAEDEGNRPGSVPESAPVASESVSAPVESEVMVSSLPQPGEPSPVIEEAGNKPEPTQGQLPGQSEPSSLTKDAGGKVGAVSDLDGGLDRQQNDGWAILQAMPDYIFRIGRGGVALVTGNGSRLGAGAAPHGTEAGQATADDKDKPQALEKIILEELARQSQQHVGKVLETEQLQTFEFQVRDDKEAHDLEVRLTPLSVGQGEVLALVRDVTLLRQMHNALIESRNELENHLKERNAELIRVNKMLKTEVELRVEQEEILKKNFHRLERLLEDTIGAITLMVERRDPHIADHQRRVSQLACAIGQEIRLKNDQMRAIRMAAQLHDLGQIFIPAEILRKPGKLTEAEKSVIRTHPDTDYQILKRIDFPISIADVVRQHHERLDGSGYPQGLKGDDILMEARILGVADVIEGMVFERPYRVAPGLEAALKEIAANKGTLYDPVVVDACLKLFTEKGFKFEPLPGQESNGQVIDRRDF